MKYLLLGLGKSNLSIKAYFNHKNIPYLIYDDNHYRNEIDINDIDVIIKSPGINPLHPLLQTKKPIVTDLEMFYLHSQDKCFITVTGSNGKTTTVNLLKHLLPDLDLGGNIGYPLFDFIDSQNDIIIEASSFMLEFINQFRSKYAIILNLYKTHLEHHYTFKNYLKSKMNIIKNALIDDYLIYNYDDSLLRRLVDSFPGIKIPFSRTQKLGFHLIGNDIIYEDKIIYNINNIKLTGNHNIENILAVIALVFTYGREIKDIESFNPIEFRLQFKGKYNGVEIYNDSKSTNFYALNSALNTFTNKQILLIVGGKNHQDKNYQFKNINHIKRIYFYGENIEEMKRVFVDGKYEAYEFNNLEEVIQNLDICGIDCILFSPGSVSYDQYPSFEERGRHFNYLIEKYLKTIYLN